MLTVVQYGCQVQRASRGYNRAILAKYFSYVLGHPTGLGKPAHELALEAWAPRLQHVASSLDQKARRSACGNDGNIRGMEES